MSAPNDTQRPRSVVSHSDNKEDKADHVESFDDTHPGALESAVLAPTFSKRVQKRAMLKIDVLVMPIVVFMYLFSSLDKSNLGNARTLGMMSDIGNDPTGSVYALLNSFYFIAYAPFMVPFALLGKRRGVRLVIGIAALVWGSAATCFAAVQNYPGAFACRFFIGFGEAGFVPLVPFYLARMYTKRDLGSRVAYWLAMAPLGGFFNGIIAYGVSFIHSHIDSWRILFLLEGLLTVMFGVLALVILPESVEKAPWLTGEEKDYLIWRKSFEASAEGNEINWKHVRSVFWRWQSVLPVFMYASQTISGAALAAFLPTFTSENGFTGANAQIATLAPYGSAAVAMIVLSYASDRVGNRGHFVNFGFVMMIAGFGIYLGVPATSHAARFAALILAETGHYISTPLIYVWTASNSGNESRRVVAVAFMNSFSQAIAVGSGYLFPKTEAPVYIKGNAVCTSLSIAGMLITIVYQFLIWRENRARDRREGKPAADLKPDTLNHADDAFGFRYTP